MYNTGQSAVVVKDLTGKEYPAIAAVNRKRRVNGQREISLSFLYTEINKDFIRELDFHWKVLFGGEWYTVINPGKQTDGDYLQVNVTAVLSFFVDLNGYYLQDKAENKSMTPANFFTELFKNTPYNFVLANNLPANTLSYEDNQSKTERFLYGIDRFAGEFVVRANTVYIHDLIGSNKDIILHEDLNVRNVSIDVDASGFHTWARGFGDLPEQTEEGKEDDYRIEISYKSPLATKYGLVEGPAIKDGNYKIAANLTEAVKNQVENSYLISSEIDAIDLSNNGYPEMVLEEGDRVWLYVSKLNLNQQVRVVEIDETFDWEGNLINVKYTVGNEGIAERYKTQQYNTLKDFKDILSGKKKIAVDWLPDAIKRASDIINGNLDSHFKYGAGEIIGINRNNPNGYMRFNTDGLGFSRDGGKTYRSAITYEGIVADAITVGTLRGIVIEAVDIIGSTITSARDENNYIMMTGPTFEMKGNFNRTWRGKRTNHDVRIRLQNGYIRARNDSLDSSLYYSDFGISTYIDGEGELGGSSGSIIWWDKTYSEAGANGLTINSYGGVVALESDMNRIVLNAKQSVNLESKEAPIYLRPLSALPGNNTFSFRLIEGSDTTNDGMLYFGSEVNGYGVGMRFSKAPAYSTVWITNGDGVRGGDATLVAGHLAANIVRSENSNYMYIGSSEEIRSVRASSWKEGTTEYISHRASSFPTSSSIKYKTNVEPYQGDVIGILMDNTIYQYHLKSNVDALIFDKPKIGMISEATLSIFRDEDGVDPYTITSFLFKVCQEQQKSIDELNQRLNDIEMVG